MIRTRSYLTFWQLIWQEEFPGFAEEGIRAAGFSPQITPAGQVQYDVAQTPSFR